MEAEQVIEKILSDARAEAEKIIKDAEQKQADEQEKLAQQLEEYGRQTQELAGRAAEDKRRRILAAARMQIAKDRLAEKARILDDVFEQAQKQLKELPDEEFFEFITRLMLAAVETGDEEVIVDKNETRIDHRFVKQVNRRLGPGYKGNLRLAEQKQDIGGGFVLRRGKIKNNVSFDVLLTQARNDLDIELAKQLFQPD